MKPEDCNFVEALNTGSVDTHFTTYHELMANKVQEILLVASLYDAYILEEDGSLASKIINEYHGLNLSRPPRLTKAGTASEAICALEQRHFDLVIAMPHLEDMDPFQLGRRIKRMHPDLPVILLTHSAREVLPEPGGGKSRGIDSVYVWTGDSDLLLALVKSAEDRMNVARDTRNAMVRVLLLVEDSPLYRSIFLPLIYKEVVHQTQAILEEGLNEEHRLLKMRARPKILVAENYEDAIFLYEKYKPYVFGVLSDTRFPQKGRMTADAGAIFLKTVKSEIPFLPLLLLSSEPENREKAREIPAVFVDKNSQVLAAEIRRFFLDSLGFGDFVFRLSDGTEIGRASTLKSLEAILPGLPDEPVLYEARRNRFSNWFMARSEINFASVLAKVPASEFADAHQMKHFIVSSIRALRKWRQRGVVVQFTPEDFDPEISDFIKVGSGSLGGKARGLAFFSNLLRQNPQLVRKFPEVSIRLPKTLVVTTEGFESLVTENALWELAESRAPDRFVSKGFLDATVPGWLESALASFLEQVKFPLSVRSSSLLEDAHFFPYAGLYKTFMIPNNHNDFRVRLLQLLTALKLVYASTFFEGPRTFSRSTAQQFRKESMAVIIQELTGTAHGDFFYPSISGIARSRNFYPVSGMKADEGVASIVVGMGKAIEEGCALRFSPRYPELLPHFSKIEDILDNAQRYFYALKIKDYEEDLNFSGGINIERRDILDAESEAPVKCLSSRYDPDENRIRDVATGPGFPVVTFSGILKYDLFPLPSLLTEFLELGRKGMGCPVELEFAVNLAPNGQDKKGEFSVLQMRPMATGEDLPGVQVRDADRDLTFCVSSQSLGHGERKDISDIVCVKPDRFDSGRTPDIAHEISGINAELVAENRPYLLVGPGRWGSFDRFLGIPVKWKNISGVGAIIELRNQNLNADPSEGSHFFQHLTDLGISYVTVTEGSSDFFDWTWIDSLKPRRHTQFVHCFRLNEAFRILTDGRASRCVMLKSRT